MSRSPKKTTIKRSFHQELVLNRWLLSLFNVERLQSFKERLGDDRFEGIHEDGHSQFFHAINHKLFHSDLIDEQTLRRYDLSIVSHWNAITEKRNKLEGHVLNMKYFQWLSLLFTEVYLDWYFNKPQALLDALNTQLVSYRNEQGAEPFRDYELSDLNKIAFWNATGSGKTLLLHVNIKQYLQYFQQGSLNSYDQKHPDKIILLTPNEGLSQQHLQELHLSGFSLSSLFDKNQTPPKGTVEVIDINKLGDDMGDKTVAVSAFEGNNLVLIDEGHKGTGTAAGAWMLRREAIISNGFAFEYSATFGQAVAKGLIIDKAEDELKKTRAKVQFNKTITKLDPTEKSQLILSSDDLKRAKQLAVRETYAKCILFDYSYKYFYEDGYGKESLILNMSEAGYAIADNREKYFTACLLAFYQQQYIWQNNRQQIADFNIEKPLWVFVGNTVSGEDSDILDVVTFLAYFLNEEIKIKAWLAEMIADRAQLLDTKGNNIFKARFTPLMSFTNRIDALYADILLRLFNASSKQRLKLVNIKKAKGELALRLGTNQPFGIINIGDDSGVFKTADEGFAISNGFDTESDEMGDGGLFKTLNDKDSALNMLIGSRKFTEGWSSWRVSTMGLLNMGQGEGSQIIQLFGRGVRLKGEGYSLKRTLPARRPKNLPLEALETINIFGVKASYMATFKDYLREEGITPSDEVLTLDFPTQPNIPKGLKTLALKDGYKDNQKLGFKRQQFPTLFDLPDDLAEKIKLPHVVLDLYPKVEALATKVKVSTAVDARSTGKIPLGLVKLFDFERIYLALQTYKQQRTWSNLRLDLQRLFEFCTQDQTWYTLYIPATEFELNRFDRVFQLENIMIQLLTEYVDRFYKTLKNAYEGQFFDVVEVDDQHASLIGMYHIECEASADGQEYHARLDALKQIVERGDLGEASKWNTDGSIPNMVAISFDRHLYYPLLSILDKDTVPLKMTPLAFDSPSEIQFVKDLQAFYADKPKWQLLVGQRSLYLLRNADSKAKGLGFALASNFYPDFLLWLVDDATGEQWLTFVDPKGLRQMDLNDPKLKLHHEVRGLESQLNKPDAPFLHLNAFILSFTRFTDLLNAQGTQQDLEKEHVLFMDDTDYLIKMFNNLNV